MKKRYIATRKGFVSRGFKFYIDGTWTDDPIVNRPYRLVCHSLRKVNDAISHGVIFSEHMYRVNIGTYTFLSEKDLRTIASILTQESKKYNVKFTVDEDLTNEIMRKIGGNCLIFYKISTLHPSEKLL